MTTTSTRTRTSTRTIRQRRREDKARRTENEKGLGSGGLAWVCFEFNSPRRGINSLEGNPLVPEASRDSRRNGDGENLLLGVFITLMERECRSWCPGRGWNGEGSVDFEGCYEIGRIITPPAKQRTERRGGGSANSRTATFGERFELLLFYEQVLRLNPSPCPTAPRDNVSR